MPALFATRAAQWGSGSRMEGDSEPNRVFAGPLVGAAENAGQVADRPAKRKAASIAPIEGEPMT
jgi:hypothetical protein